MTVKMSMRTMRNAYPRVLCLGYCEAPYLLRGLERIAYSAGIYGWNCDWYERNGIGIATGYRTPNSKGMRRDYARIAEYESEARKIWSEERDYKTAKARVETLLDEMLFALREEEK